jgi:molecular chaperone GrpE
MTTDERVPPSDEKHRSDTTSPAARDDDPSPSPASDPDNAATALERCREEAAALKEQLLRRAAEFENFRRRTREEQADVARYAIERLLLEQLPVIDDLRRSLAAGKEHPDFETFYAGIELVYAKWMKALAARGLRPMEVVGTPFNVDLHDAMLVLPCPGAAPGTVIDEIETGYMLHDRVLRHAKVTVAAGDPGGAEREPS